MPRDAVYPAGDSTKEIEQHNLGEMKKSQDSATEAALGYLGKDPQDVKVNLQLADVGGPSAGLLLLPRHRRQAGRRRQRRRPHRRPYHRRYGHHHRRREGRRGRRGRRSRRRPPGGTARRCSWCRGPSARDAKAELPKGMRLVPVTTLRGAVSALTALDKGEAARSPAADHPAAPSDRPDAPGRPPRDHRRRHPVRRRSPPAPASSFATSCGSWPSTSTFAFSSCATVLFSSW